MEWEGEGEPDKPLLKDKFAAERRKVRSRRRQGCLGGLERY